MAVSTIDAKLLSKMFLSGAKNLESKKDYINELNVFPVPDGDTGTNMTLTIMSAANDVSALENPDMVSLCKSMSSGSLRGARGNSGVILSQLLRGLTKVIKDYDTLDVPALSAGFDKAVESAYKAVMKPKEGTILTVAKGMAEKANMLFEEGEENIQVFLEEVIKYGDEVLSKTPDMLPVLKEAGVVDSGGQGLMEVLHGAYDAFMGKEISFSMDDNTAKVASKTRMLPAETGITSDVKYAYEISIKIDLVDKQFNVKNEDELTKYLSNIGENIEIKVDANIVSIGIVTNDPGLVLQKSIKIGEVSDITLKNMRLENVSKDSVKNDTPRKPVGFIAVSAGKGIGEIFKNIGVDYLIEGGQTMNPSTEDMLNAIDKINADTIYILPNNKNIIMAANQARDLTEDKNIIVIPTKTVPQGISAMIGYVADMSDEDNTAAMNDAIAAVKTGQVTYAVRDTTIEGHEIHEGDYMGIGDSGILSNGKDILDVTMDMISSMIDDSSEIISIYTGADIEDKVVEELKSKISEKYPKCDLDVQNGEQPVYYFIVSIE